MRLKGLALQNLIAGVFDCTGLLIIDLKFEERFQLAVLPVKGELFLVMLFLEGIKVMYKLRRLTNNSEDVL